MSTIPLISFFIPESNWSSDGWPEKPDDYWSWLCRQNILYPGMYAWILQTYLHLNVRGFPCKLTSEFPPKGIVIAHRYSLSDWLKPDSNLLTICVQADCKRHPYAQMHVVQNPKQQGYYIPHWPQADLIPRDPTRGETFENIAYVGHDKQLAPELQDESWTKQMEALGFRWQILRQLDQWNNYRNIDAILAIRQFGDVNPYAHKPASKLYNSWLANVPCILGYEFAYQSERKSHLDYLEATSKQHIIVALNDLRDNPNVRTSMVANGKRRAAALTPDVLAKQWSDFLLHKAMPAYDCWCRTPGSL